MAGTDRACFVGRGKCGPLDRGEDQWRRDTEVQDVFGKCAEGVYVRKGKVLRGGLC